ncbi:MAG: hypothetical protein VB137_08795 [Burkholderia sp.]
MQRGVCWYPRHQGGQPLCRTGANQPRGHEQFGSVEADAGRGLSLGIDHGSQYRSDDFRAQLKFWRITPSYAFVAEPQTHGVAERFNRTMEEHGYPRAFVQPR